MGRDFIQILIPIFIIFSSIAGKNLTMHGRFDLTGRLISGFDLGLQQAGRQNLHWSPSNHSTMGLSSGMYIYQIETGKTITNGKMMYLK
jgi:hypothetical protein